MWDAEGEFAKGFRECGRRDIQKEARDNNRSLPRLIARVALVRLGRFLLIDELDGYYGAQQTRGFSRRVASFEFARNALAQRFAIRRVNFSA